MMRAGILTRHCNDCDQDIQLNRFATHACIKLNSQHPESTNVDNSCSQCEQEVYDCDGDSTGTCNNNACMRACIISMKTAYGIEMSHVVDKVDECKTKLKIISVECEKSHITIQRLYRLNEELQNTIKENNRKYNYVKRDLSYLNQKYDSNFREHAKSERKIKHDYRRLKRKYWESKRENERMQRHDYDSSDSSSEDSESSSRSYSRARRNGRSSYSNPDKYQKSRRQ